jgi:PTH1 family peptidyl-tRNA hydrolase
MLRRLLHRGREESVEEDRTGTAEGRPPKPIELVVGLGNPGSEYAGNRHNVGFWAVNRLGRKVGIEPRSHSRLVSLGEGQYAGRRLVLAKPRTFMNRSGVAVKDLLRRYRLEPSQALIIYDELDLPVGRVRVRARGSHGGARGFRSVVEQLGTQDIPRIRIGIGRPTVGGEPSWDPEVVADYVLSDPPPDERARLDEAVARAVDAVLCILDEGLETAMNRFNRD